MNRLEEKGDSHLEKFVFGLAVGSLAIVLFRAVRLIAVGGWLGTDRARKR